MKNLDLKLKAPSKFVTNNDLELKNFKEFLCNFLSFNKKKNHIIQDSFIEISILSNNSHRLAVYDDFSFILPYFSN